MDDTDDTAMFDSEAIAETNMALLCTIDGADVWVPKSQIDSDSDVQEDGDCGTLIVKAWWAEEKGLV